MESEIEDGRFGDGGADNEKVVEAILRLGENLDCSV
jgi:hypothetical protein